MTLELARAAALDAGNRNMTRNCRMSWNADDWNVACAVLEHLWLSNGVELDVSLEIEIEGRL